MFFVFVLTVNLSHFLSKSSLFWQWEDSDALGACVWAAALQRAHLHSFSLGCNDRNEING